MSDLLIAAEALLSPSAACIEVPPTSGTDPCHFDLGLVEVGSPAHGVRSVRFDRSGDQFILSPSNGLDLREWFESHENSPEILQYLRFMNAMMRVPTLRMSPETSHFMMTMAQYVVSGEVNEFAGGVEHASSAVDLGRQLLEIFAGTDESVLGPFLGQLQVIRRATWLGEDAQARLRWVSSIVDLVPQYRDFRQYLLEPADLENYYTIDASRRRAVDWLYGLSGQIIAADSLGEPMHYDSVFVEANDAYNRIYGPEIDAGSREDFCTALEAALSQLRGARGGAERGYLAECRTALRLRDLAPEEALRASLRDSFLDDAGMRRLQDGIATESAEANMTVSWLSERGDAAHQGRIGEMLDHALAHLSVRFPESGPAELSLDVPSLNVELQTLIDAHATSRREYVLAAIAVLRRLAADDATVRVFYSENFQDVTLDAATREALRPVLASLERQIESSHASSDLLLPILEGGLCLVGAAGVVLAETIPELRSDQGLHLGIGTSGAAIGGAGCSAFIGHFIWPAIGEVHNRYLWDGITGLVGGVVGAGIYLLISLLAGGSVPFDMGTRYPVDPFGP